VVLYARACLEHGRAQDGIDALLRIEERVNAGERWMEPEYLRLRARLQHAHAPGDAQLVQQRLREALALAQQQDALVFVEAIEHDIHMFSPAASAPLADPRL
jgi:hypothetical protein